MRFSQYICCRPMIADSLSQYLVFKYHRWVLVGFLFWFFVGFFVVFFFSPNAGFPREELMLGNPITL